MHASMPINMALASLVLTGLTPLVAAQDSTDSAAGSTITDDLNSDNNVNCPGVLVNNNGDSYCCVGGELTLSTCPGWPICTGSGTVDTATQTESCVTRIPVTQSDYSELISSYSESLSGGGSGGATATATGDDTSDSTSTGTPSATESGSQGAQETGADTSSTSSDSSGGRVGPMGAVAGGLLGLAAML